MIGVDTRQGDIVKHFNAKPDDGDNIVVHIDKLNAVL